MLLVGLLLLPASVAAAPPARTNRQLYVADDPLSVKVVGPRLSWSAVNTLAVLLDAYISNSHLLANKYEHWKRN